MFTLADTDTDTNTDKMGLQPICICVTVSVGVGVSVDQCEHFCILELNPFFSDVCVSVGVGQCEHTINEPLVFNFYFQMIGMERSAIHVNLASA